MEDTKLGDSKFYSIGGCENKRFVHFFSPILAESSHVSRLKGSPLAPHGGGRPHFGRGRGRWQNRRSLRVPSNRHVAPVGGGGGARPGRPGSALPPTPRPVLLILAGQGAPTFTSAAVPLRQLAIPCPCPARPPVAQPLAAVCRPTQPFSSAAQPHPSTQSLRPALPVHAGGAAEEASPRWAPWWATGPSATTGSRSCGRGDPRGSPGHRFLLRPLAFPAGRLTPEGVNP